MVNGIKVKSITKVKIKQRDRINRIKVRDAQGAKSLRI